MPIATITHTVPSSVRRVVEAAVEHHKQSSLTGVGGIGVAKSLLKERVSTEVVEKMVRFFTAQSKPYTEAIQLQMTEDTDSLVQSWGLHGGDAGRVWSQKRLKKAVTEGGYSRNDDVIALLTMRPEEVYEAFSMSAWKWEFDLTPSKAARFVEEYQRATGFILELGKAFGESATTVGNAIYRRYHTENPFETLAKALNVQDEEVQMAATLDLEVLKSFEKGLVSEAMLKPAIYQKQPMAQAKALWPVFIAHLILASESPKHLSDANLMGKKPAEMDDKPQNYQMYSDAVNIFHLYYHPEGKRYVEPTGKFSSHPSVMWDVVWKAWYGKKIQVQPLKKLLGVSRQWLSQNKLVGGVFQILLAYWNKGNWQGILDLLPPDSDMYMPFKNFVGMNPLTKGELKLQQTLQDKTLLELVSTAFASQFLPSDKSASVKIPSDEEKERFKNSVLQSKIAVKNTALGKVMAAKSTPLGVMSLCNWNSTLLVCLGAYTTPLTGIQRRFAFKVKDSNQIAIHEESQITAGASTGSFTVVQAHIDMKGSAYGTEPIVSRENPPVVDDGMFTDDEKKALSSFPNTPVWQSDEFGQQFQRVRLSETKSHAYFKKSGVSMVAGLSLYSPQLEQNFSVVGAAKHMVDDNPALTWTFILVRYTGSMSGMSKVYTVWTHETSISGTTYAVASDEWFRESLDSGLFTLSTPSDVVKSSAPDDVEPAPLHDEPEIPTLPATWMANVAAGDYLTGGSSEYERVIQVDGDSSKFTRVVYTQSLQPNLGNPNFDHVTVQGGGISLAKVYTQQQLEWASLGFISNGGMFLFTEQTNKIMGALCLKATGEHLMFPLHNPNNYDAILAQYPDLYDAERDFIASSVNLNMPFTYGPTKYEPAYLFNNPNWTSASGLTPSLGVLAFYTVKMLVGPHNLSEAQKGTLPILDEVYGAIQFDTFPLSGVYKPDSPHASVMDIVKSSYDPPEVRPQSTLGDDVVDPEQGNFAMSGTKLAHNYIKHLNQTGGNFVPAAGGDLGDEIIPAAKFKYGLGSVFSGGVHPWRVIGYARVPLGSGQKWVYIYDMLLETGERKIGWLAVGPFELEAQGKQYSGVDQDIINALLPTPEDKAKQKFPKLDYHLSKGAKEANEAEEWIYYPTPQEATLIPKFKVGAHIAHEEAFGPDSLGENALHRGRILGWIRDTPDSDIAVALQNSDPVTREKYPFWVLPWHKLDGATLIFDYESEMKPGSVTFGQNADDDPIHMSIFDGDGELKHLEAKVVTPPESHWDETPAVHQPPFEYLPKGQHISAGVVALLPPKSYATNAEDGDQEIFEGGVALFHPKTAFGGYKLALPKGTIEKGEAIEVGAAREVWEECGFLVKPVAHLGDFKTNTSVTRMFIGFVTGGSGYTGDESESDATVVKDLGDYEKWKKDLIPDSGNKWQQKVIEAAKEWVQVNGHPMTVPVIPSASGQHTQISSESDSPEPLPAQDWINKSLFDWMQMHFPYPVTTGMRVELETVVRQRFGVYARVDVSGLESEDEFGKVFVAQGYGDTPDKPTPYTFVGYVWAQGYDEEGELDDQNLRYYAFGLSDSAKKKVALIDLTDDENLLDFQTPTQDEPKLEAWFEHPDETHNQMLQNVYDNGGVAGSGLTMAKFRSFLKKMKFPHAATIQKTMAYSVSSLFHPATVTQKQYDLIMLKLSSDAGTAVKGAIFTEKPKLSEPAFVSGEDTGGGALAVIVKLNIDAPIYKQILSNPDPEKFTDTGESLPGGSKPNRVLDGPGGQYFFKGGNVGDPNASAIAELEGAFYQMTEAVKPGQNIPVGTMTIDGQKGSIQALATPATPPPASPNELTDENKTVLLAQHAVDMYIGDHDGHAGNLLMVEGQLRAIDKGQGLRFLIEGAKESLDPNFHDPKRNLSGKSYAKKLLLSWGAGEATIPLVAFKSMYQTILSIQALFTIEYLTPMLSLAFDEFKFSKKKRASLLQALVDRASTYEKDWLVVMKKLRSDFTWPTGVTVKANPSLKHSPELMEFSEEEETLVKEAAQAGWQGKALRIDRNYIEGQEVVVKSVQYKGSPGTLAYWRITNEAGMVIENNLLPVSEKVEVTADSATHIANNRLTLDIQNGYYDKIVAAVKSLNHHLFVEKDIKVNEGTISAAIAIRPGLKEIYDKASGQEGPWKDTGLPTPNVYQMATTYLNHIATIEYVHQNLDDHLGKYTKWLDAYEVDFNAQEEKPDIGEATIESLPFKCKYMGKRAVFPRTEGSSAQPGVPLQIVNLNEISFSESVPQFQIEDNAGAKVFIVPTDPSKVQVAGRRGHCWGFIAEAASKNSVAHILRLFEVASGVKMKPASKDDREAMYWMKQAHILQQGGKVSPQGSMGDTTVEAGAKDVLQTYRNGDSAAAVLAAKKIVAGKIGVSVDELEGLPGYEPDGVFNQDGGRRKQVRLGWDRAKLKKTLGQNVSVCHHTRISMDDLLGRMKRSGPVLLANEERPYGAVEPGAGSASATSDFGAGGSQGVFTCFRDYKKQNHYNHLCFDISLALRTDCYFVGTGDTYGSITAHPKHMNPESWPSITKGQGGSTVGSSSTPQFNVRYDIDLREYLIKAICSTDKQRSRCITICDEMGWKFKHGTPEELFVTA